MSFNWSIITNKIFGILKGSCDSVRMYDAKGNETIDPDEATRFFAVNRSHNPALEKFTFLVSVIDNGQNSYINLKTPKLSNEQDWSKIYKIRHHIRKSVGQKEGIHVIWQVFDKEIEPREEAVNNIHESKDISKWFGTTKSSFQRIGEAKVIVRHSDVVNQDKHGARTRHVKAIFVENKNGERFAYPHLHLNGAKAFARHLSNGGTNFDDIAESLYSLSADYVSLKRAAFTMRQNQVLSEYIVGIREQLDLINKRMKSVQGPKGYQNAASILVSPTVILDEQATENLLQIFAEQCSCQQGDDTYSDLSVAARYVGTASPFPAKPQFKWSRRPNVSNVPSGMPVQERLQLQLKELSDACEDTRSAARLSEIAIMIADNRRPTEEDLSFVREAINSSLNIVEDEQYLPEEIEIDNFLSEFDPTKIFGADNVVENSEVSSDTSKIRFIPGFPGEVIDQAGDLYLTWFPDRHDAHTVKNEYEIVRKVGDKWEYVDNLNMPYDPPGRAVKAFREKATTLGEGWHAVRPINTDRYQERSGLEGPFMTKSGKTVYYDPKEGKYYDPDSDFYIDHDDYAAMNEDDFNESNGFLKGDHVKHKESGQHGVVVGQPEGNEYPVKFEGDDEVYFTPVDVLDIVVDESEDTLEEGPADNFTIDDIKHLEKLQDLGQMKDFAKKLISTPSQKPMKPQKVMWLSQAIDSKRRPGDIVKLMYDLLLGGEGLSVVGSKTSMDPNSYRRAFGEDNELNEISSDTLKSYVQKSGQGNVPGFGGKGPFTDKDWKRSKSMSAAQDLIRRKEKGPMSPTVHDMTQYSDGEVYDITQTDDDLEDGDVLKLSGGRLAVLVQAWPVMVVGQSDALHQLKPDKTWESFDRGLYSKSAEIARSIAAEGSHMKEDEIVRIKTLAGI